MGGGGGGAGRPTALPLLFSGAGAAGRDVERTAAASASASLLDVRRMWYASRCAVFGPTPGSFESSSIRRASGRARAVGKSHPRKLQAAGEAAELVGRELFGLGQRVGYQLAGVREDEDAAEALGIATRRRKVQAIVVSAAVTSMCGSLWAQYVGFVDPAHVFSIDLSIRFALNSIIGGMGTALGPFLGSVLITSLETYLRATFSGIPGFSGTYLIIYGIVLILMVRFAPDGLTGIAGRFLLWRARAQA